MTKRPRNRGAAAMVQQMASAASAKVNPLFGSEDDTRRLVELDVERIAPNPFQARRHFDEEELEGLARSIRKEGLLEPILVKETDKGHYQLLGGERRLRAAKMNGATTILAILTEGDPAEIGLIENLQRVDLHPLEEMVAFQGLIEAHGYTHEQLAEIVGKGRTYVTRILSLGSIPAAILEEYRGQSRDISRSAMYELAAEADPQRQAELWGLLKGGATVRDIREARAEAEAGDNAQEGDDGEKAEDTGASPPPAGDEPERRWQRAIKAVGRFHKSIAILQETPRSLSQEERTSLAALRDALMQILEQKTE